MLNRNSNLTWLIRESKRVNGKPVITMLANFTWPPVEIIGRLRFLFVGVTAVKSVQEVFTLHGHKSYGHGATVLGMMNQPKSPKLIAEKNSFFRRLAL